MNDSDIPEPTPSLSPKDVIKVQVNALADNDSPFPDAGVEAAFSFASPANKEQTGPLPKFKRMLHAQQYGPMINHVDAEYGLFERDGDKASQVVTLTTSDDDRVAYEFQLSLQEGNKHDGCWMTDSVYRL